ncbi:4565_t:CDS:2 [Cetraspora pellucida]|uniref:4565_t:CDS:1 n=1 Tax=Cetraspora pellucida TaxID=1433469 RepID=A0ACA9NWV1_9GLOM|nr:4565_t:CDS:2 [Cetraspora pellucida]
MNEHISSFLSVSDSNDTEIVEIIDHYSALNQSKTYHHLQRTGLSDLVEIMSFNEFSVLSSARENEEYEGYYGFNNSSVRENNEYKEVYKFNNEGIRENDYGFTNSSDKENEEYENNESSSENNENQKLKDPESLYPIAENMVFARWKELDEWLNNHRQEHGFAITITYSDNNKNDELPQCCVYACIKGRTYTSCKEAHKINDHDRGHHTGNCEFQVNAYRQKTDNQVHISKVCSQHNHALVENIGMITPSYRKLTSEMHDDRKNSEKYIHQRNIYNLIQTIRHQKGVISDAGSMYLTLLKQQQDSPTFHAKFHNVVLIDTTAKTNRDSMILCVIILIDNHNCSRLVATALLSDETADTFTWLFTSLNKATSNLFPCLLYTDSDPAMIVAAKNCWPMTKHYFCLFHIRKNLENHFLNKYRAILLQEYSDAADYLKWQLYECSEALALCFTHCAFNAGVQSTQRIESYNAIIKKNVNGSFSLLELERTIEKLLAKESCFVHLNETINKLPISREENYCDRYFQRISIESLEDMFSESMFDTRLIELEQLVEGLEWNRIHESSPTEPSAQIDFSHLESIRRCHIFTDEVQHKLTRKQQWGKGFGLMKKTLDLAIATGRAEELYELYLNLFKKMEIEIATKEGQLVEQNDDKNNFISTISNSVNVRTKGRKKHKREKDFNDTSNINKGKRRKVDESDKDSDYSKKLPNSSLDEVLNTQASSSRQCHNARTCSNREVVVYIE